MRSAWIGVVYHVVERFRHEQETEEERQSV